MKRTIVSCLLLAGLSQGCANFPLASSSNFVSSNNAAQAPPPAATTAPPGGTPVVSAPGAPIQTTSGSSPAAPAPSAIQQAGATAAAPFAASPAAPTVPTKSPFNINHRDKENIPVGAPRQVQALWENRVVNTSNVAANGQSMPCLAGRVYLMGEQVGHSFRSNGTCIVDAYEVLPGGKMKMIERWEFNNEMLSKLLFKDSIGWGYTLFLPWTTYRPDINRVQLQAKFIPETGGVPLFSPASTISLTQQNQPSIHSATITPTAGRN